MLEKISPTTSKSQIVPRIVKLLVTFLILAYGSFQTTLRIVSGLRQLTVTRMFMQVIDDIVELVPEYIHFPQRVNE